METYHDIDDENGDVTQRATARPQVRERLVSGRIDNKQPRDLELEAVVLHRPSSAPSSLPAVRERTHLIQNGRLRLDSLNREIRRTDLLRNPSRLALLNIRLPDLIQQLRLARIDVSQDTADRTSQIILAPGR